MEEINKKQIDRNRYRSSFSATVLFSGVQIYQILIRIIKSKFVALFIGPAGMGISSLLRSTTDTVSVISNFGLNTSSVKTIAAANRDADRSLIARTITAQRRLVLLAGVVGMVICATLSPFWSKTSFGNDSYILSFVIVSIIILLDQVNGGELALLQGMQERKQLAKATIIGQTLNAIVTIPLFYFYGIKAIVATMVLGSLISLCISLFFSHRIGIPKVKMSWKETFIVGNAMIKLGFFLSLQSIMSTIVVLIIRNYIGKFGGIDEVGLYSAGTMIVSNYIGLVFTAMATDYFPRLAATKSNEEMNLAVRTQAELMILLLCPLVVAFLVFIRPVIILLYSEKFLPIEHMMYWAVGAVLIQAMAWAVSHTLLAKAKPIYFFLNEFFTTIWGLPVKLFFYKWWGLTGFGMATMIVYLLYLLQVLIVTKKLFGISYELSLWSLFFLLNALIVATVFLKFFLPEECGYICGFIILLITGAYVYYKLNQKLDLQSFVEGRLTKIFQNN